MDSDEEGTDTVGFIPRVVPLPGFWCSPGFVETIVEEALGSDCLLRVKVLIVQFLLEGF